MTAALIRDPRPVEQLLGLLAAAAEARRPAPAEAAPDEIQSLRDRDPNAWHALFEREMSDIFRYVLARLGNHADAEDVTSAVFEEAWKSGHRLRDRGLPARAWLFGVARHVVNRHRRWHLRQPPTYAIAPLERAAHAGEVDSALLDLGVAIAQLSRAHAEVVSLRFIHGLSLAETATVLECSEDAVKGRQARALQELRRLLGEGEVG